jgi:hypothetical protein
MAWQSDRELEGGLYEGKCWRKGEVCEMKIFDLPAETRIFPCAPRDEPEGRSDSHVQHVNKCNGHVCYPLGHKNLCVVKMPKKNNGWLDILNFFASPPEVGSSIVHTIFFLAVHTVVI